MVSVASHAHKDFVVKTKKVLMKCGHRANAIRSGRPVCLKCLMALGNLMQKRHEEAT